MIHLSSRKTRRKYAKYLVGAGSSDQSRSFPKSPFRQHCRFIRCRWHHRWRQLPTFRRHASHNRGFPLVHSLGTREAPRRNSSRSSTLAARPDLGGRDDGGSAVAVVTGARTHMPQVRRAMTPRQARFQCHAGKESLVREKPQHAQVWT